jgi:hypothetical protein
MTAGPGRPNILERAENPSLITGFRGFRPLFLKIGRFGTKVALLLQHLSQSAEKAVDWGSGGLSIGIQE